jgi:hypothetical protein
MDELKHGAFCINSGENWLALVGKDKTFVPVEPAPRSHRPANNLAKNWDLFDIVIPRSRLKSVRGQGPDFEVQAYKEVTSTQSVGGGFHGGKEPKKRKESSDSA